ncbi:MAG TPA: ABC transporter substrate-binding protein [Baekduia sp.]|nr:ABC transporter substrate-binding protein [Baekduia sp.]
MPKAPTRLILLCAMLVALAASVAACGSDSSSSSSSSESSSSSSSSSASIPAKPESGTFRMGIEPWLGYGPWHIAQSKGYFQQNGLDVKITNFETDDQINSAFASGKLDGTNIATHTALRFAAAGLPIKIVLLEDESLKADAILSGPDVTSIKDLKGKKVAYEEGTTSDILLSYALAHNGMSKQDIQPVPIPAADAGSAFIAGKVPVAVTYEPYLTTALKQNKDAKLLYTAGEDPGLVSDVFVVSEDTLNNKPGQIAALIKTWGQSVDYYNNNKKDAQAIISKAVGAKPGELTTAFDGVKFYSLADNKDQLGGSFVNQTIEDVKKAATDAGLLEGDVNPSDIVVAKFVQGG